MVNDIETYPANQKYEINIEDYLAKLNDMRGEVNQSDDDSLNSEDE